MTHPSVLVLIINYKTSHLMQKLLDSVNEMNVDVSILIVDNASTAESLAGLQALNDARVHIIKSEKNLGFTGGINFGLKYAIENMPKFKYLLLFNPDALSTTNLIRSLLEIMEQEKNAASVSPRIVYPDGNPWYSGAEINLNKGKVYNNPVKKNETEKKYYEVDVFSGCAVLFDLDKIIKAGMFNEDLFMYYDEADLSIRLKKLGYKILYTPAHTIFHDVSYTTKDITHLKTYYMTRNKFIVFNNSMSVKSKIYFIIHELAYHLKNRRLKNAIYHLRGFYDFLKNKKGAYGEAN